MRNKFISWCRFVVVASFAMSCQAGMGPGGGSSAPDHVVLEKGPSPGRVVSADKITGEQVAQLSYQLPKPGKVEVGIRSVGSAKIQRVGIFDTIGDYQMGSVPLDIKEVNGKGMTLILHAADTEPHLIDFQVEKGSAKEGQKLILEITHEGQTIRIGETPVQGPTLAESQPGSK